ncbi:MAG TPA: phosphoglycerate dehydrogenase family protein [Lachnospiraceae bacterium]|nr:phosphoglycerate dehydrogenase family protein [Lachnospiraceae bacterium]
MAPLFWIIDEEWPDYEVETRILKEKYPDCIIKFSTNDYKKDLEEFGYMADAIIAQVYVYIPKETIERLEKCKCIALFGGGFDRVDIEAAKEKGIMVTNVQGYCAEDLADYVISGIYYFGKKLDFYKNAVEKGLWGAQSAQEPVRRIKGSTLLIIGCGKIGSTVAKRAKALDVNIIAYDPYVDQNKMDEYCVKKVELEEGLKTADFISINAKYYEGTHHLLTKKHFQLMKKTAYLINTARGRIINEQDMIDAVNKGLIAGAVVDVISNEPPSTDEAIFDCEKIVVTPHVSYISEESYMELKVRATNNVIKMLNGERPSDLVNG